MPARELPHPLRASLLLWAPLAWVLGTALQLQQRALWDAEIYAGILAVALAVLGLIAIKSRAIFRFGGRILVASSAVLLLAWGGTGLRACYFAADRLDPALEGRDLWVTGVVTDMPQRTEAGLRFRLQVETAQDAGVRVQLPPRMDLGWYGALYPVGNETVALQRQPQDLQAGERWAMLVRLKAPHGGRNPFGFDYELLLWEQGVQATGYVRAGAADPVPQRLAQTWTHPVALARQALRARIFAAVEPRPVAGLIAALVVGDQNAIDRSDWDLFRATGVAHLVSISGLHITMFAWGAAWLVGSWWRRSARRCLALPAPTAALLGGVLLANAYAVFSGWGLPAQRTCLMLATVAGLRLAGLRWPWPQVWMLACAVVVASDPWALTQAGFWLSFVAVGILFATDSGASGRESAGLTRRIALFFREQWVVTVALAPLTLLMFGQVSLVGLVANALAIPWVTLVVTPLAMLGALVPALWEGAALAIGLLMAWLQWLASWPWASVSLAAAPSWAGAAGVLGALLLVASVPWHMRGLGLALVLPVALWQAPAPAVGEFELLAADVGQGNAVLVRTAGHALLFDAGPRYSLESDAGHRVLLPLLQALQVRLDTVVLSHRDTDHVGGAPAVLGMQPQAQLLSSMEDWRPPGPHPPAQRCEQGQHWEWDGVRFDILHPAPADYLQSAKPNAMSCVLRISNTAHAALLAGDIEKPQEARLLALGADLRADVLLVPHHGSKTSSSDAFLDAVQPGMALVQSGYRNRFGHPAAPVLQRYQAHGIRVLDSPHCGAMAWSSSAPQAFGCTRLDQLRYWNHRVP
jgi:competence protein ComEC